MIGPKKPRSASKAPAAPALTADQLHVAKLFKSMDEKYQAALLPMIVEMAAKFPRRARPALRLVGGGAS